MQFAPLQAVATNRSIKSKMRSTWQLPAGVDRGLLSYFNDPEVARGYDQSLADSHLPRVDVEFFAQHCRPAGRVLDLGCGTGRVLVDLARQGFWPVGVDFSEEMLR